MAKTQVIGRVIPAPKDWSWNSGLLRPSGESLTGEQFDRVYAWAKNRSYGLQPVNAISFYTPGGAYLESWCVYRVWKDSWEITEKFLGDGKWTAYPDVSLGKTEHVNGVNGGIHWNRCSACLRHGLKIRPSFGRTGGRTNLCAFCSTPCSANCGLWSSLPVARAEGAEGKCLDCFPRIYCYLCDRYAPTKECEVIPNGREVCKSCADTRRCSDCGSVDVNIRKIEGRLFCESCYGRQLEAQREPHEKFDAEELPKGESLALRNLPNRPIRVISIETEVDGDPARIATTLYNCGIVREAFVESYGTRVPEDSQWPAFLKHDGSVTGGEVINFLLKLDEEGHAESLKNVLSKLRSLHKTGYVQYNANCGGHIHIDAHNFSSDNLWRLLTGYNYLEDVIYRLAGAGHEYGHRTLVNGHDRANGGAGYARNTSKGPWGVKSSAFLAASLQNRMTGLNFVPYFQAIRYCECGASKADNLRKCTCILPKCTIEWRVWNTQTNPRILHAWLAFMQSLHAWADSPKEMTDVEEREYPVLGWTQRPWEKTSEGHKTAALERVRWIFSNLVFTNEEKDSLLYAFSETDMEFSEGFLEEMRRIPTPKNRTVKAPHYRFCRRQAIMASPPAKKMHGKIRRGGGQRHDGRIINMQEYGRIPMGGRR